MKLAKANREEASSTTTDTGVPSTTMETQTTQTSFFGENMSLSGSKPEVSNAPAGVPECSPEPWGEELAAEVPVIEEVDAAPNAPVDTAAKAPEPRLYQPADFEPAPIV